MREIWVETGTTTEFAVVEDGHLCEYISETSDDTASSEKIYLGRVERVITGMQAAFVNIGQSLNGFLPLQEKGSIQPLPKLQAGMSVLVQVKKEAHGTKGAFLSRDITLCSELLIYMPMNHFIGVSAKIEDERKKKQLKALGNNFCGNTCGVVFRTAAQQADDALILASFEKLKELWCSIQQKAATAHVPSLVYHPRDILRTLLDDYCPKGIDRIVTNDETLHLERDSLPIVYTDDAALMLHAGWIDARNKGLKRKVWLKNGGNLVFDACEALTVIDVNTAKYTGTNSIALTALQMNLQACEEIARQLRLRNISGIIIIDMIDMVGEDDRQRVLEAMREALRRDRIKTVIHGFTSLGLLEITRKKTRQSLA